MGQGNSTNSDQFGYGGQLSEEFIKGYRQGYHAGYRDGIRDAYHAVGKLRIEDEDIPLPAAPVILADQDDIRYLGFSNRTRNALHRGHIMTISELRRRTVQELLDLRGLGPLAVDEIKAKLAERGYTIAEY